MVEVLKAIRNGLLSRGIKALRKGMQEGIVPVEIFRAFVSRATFMGKWQAGIEVWNLAPKDEAAAAADWGMFRLGVSLMRDMGGGMRGVHLGITPGYTTMKEELERMGKQFTTGSFKREKKSDKKDKGDMREQIETVNGGKSID
jgi:hypothetical protein